MLFPAFFLGILLRIPSGGAGEKYDRRWGRDRREQRKERKSAKTARTAEEENLHSGGDCSCAGYDSSFILLKTKIKKEKQGEEKEKRLMIILMRPDTPTAKARWVLIYIHFQIYSKAYETDEFL